MRFRHRVTASVNAEVVRIAAPTAIHQMFGDSTRSILGWAGSRPVLKVHQADNPMIVPDTLYVVPGCRSPLGYMVLVTERKSHSSVTRKTGVSGVKCRSTPTGLVSNTQITVSRGTSVSPGAGPKKTPTQLSSAKASPPTSGELLFGRAEEGVE